MNYLVIGRDRPGAHDQRQKNRDAHLAGAKALKEAGHLLFATAMIEDGKMVGSVMVFDFETQEAFDAWKENEPYLTGEVWGEVEITECAVPPLFKS